MGNKPAGIAVRGVMCLALIFIVGLVLTGVWYMIDDAIAQLAGSESLGSQPFWFVQALAMSSVVAFFLGGVR